MHQCQHDIAPAELNDGLASVQGCADAHALVTLSTEQPTDDDVLTVRGGRARLHGQVLHQDAQDHTETLAAYGVPGEYHSAPC